MNIVKKVSLILAIMLVIVVGFAGESFAALKLDPNLNISKSELQPGEEFTVTYSIANVQGDKGVIALSGEIKYDKNVLELVRKSGSNSWSNPSINASTNSDMFVTDREDLGKVNETVFTLTFKVKEGATGNINIATQNVVASDGDVEENIANVSKTITIKKVVNKDDEVTNIPTSTTNKNQTATLPKTGEGHFGIIAGVSALVFGVLATVFYRRLNK